MVTLLCSFAIFSLLLLLFLLFLFLLELTLLLFFLLLLLLLLFLFLFIVLFFPLPLFKLVWIRPGLTSPSKKDRNGLNLNILSCNGFSILFLSLFRHITLSYLGIGFVLSGRSVSLSCGSSSQVVSLKSKGEGELCDKQAHDDGQQFAHQQIYNQYTLKFITNMQVPNKSNLEKQGSLTHDPLSCLGVGTAQEIMAVLNFIVTFIYFFLQVPVSPTTHSNHSILFVSPFLVHISIDGICLTAPLHFKGEMQLDLARTLSEITLLSPIDFEHQLLLVRDSPLILKLLGQLLASNLSGEQKQLAAVAVNQVIKHRLDTDGEQWRSLWLEYLACVLDSPQIEAISWSHLNITAKALEKLMDEFQAQFCDCLNPIFKRLHFKSKALIYESFLYAQTTPKTKIIFIRETFEDYMNQALAFACSNHESPPDQDRYKLELVVLEALSEVLAKFKQETDEKIVELMLKLAENMEIFQLVIEELLFDPTRGGYESVMKHEFAPERMNELVLSTEQVESNILKAKVIKVYTALLMQYDTQSGLEEFDRHKYLFFMESLTPLVVQHLITLAKRPRQGEKEIIEQLLAFLTTSCSFMFMLKTFQDLYKKIYYHICLPLLATNQEEHELYLSDWCEFTKMAEELIEQPNEKSETVKNAAGAFLEKVTHTVHGKLKFAVYISVQAIRTMLLSQTFPEILEAIQNYDYRPNIDTAFTILSIFSYAYQKREDLCKFMRQQLLDVDELLKLQDLEKARFLIFLEYNYQELFRHNAEEGRRFLIYAEKGLDESQTVSRCSLHLFQNCLKLGFGDDIWVSLIKRIDTKSDIFSLLQTIVQQMLDKLPVERVKDLIARVITRLVNEFRKCQEEAKEGTVKGSKTLFSCLDILGSIAENSAYLKEQPGIVDALWPVFDMFQFAERIEFQDNILAIFNKILEVEKELSHRHFAFLPFFLSIYEKQAEFGALLHTINMLVTKGSDYLLTKPEARIDLEALLSFLRETYGVMKNQATLKHILVLFHYIHWEYDSVLDFDRDFIIRLMEIYQLQHDYMKDETKAALINFLLLCEFKYGRVDLRIIEENTIQIFRGYQGKLFAAGLRHVIEKQPEQEQLLTYLRYSIRLLHFIREIKLAPRQPQLDYYSPPFPETQQLDPFQQICQSLNHIKRTLPQHHYDHILSQLNSEISLGEIKDLLSRRLVDNSLRAIKRVRQE